MVKGRDIVKHLTYDLIREISLKHQHSVCGLFEKGVGQGEMEEAATPSSKDCKYSSFVLMNTYT